MLDVLDGLSDEEVVAELRRRVLRCDCIVVVVGFGRGSTPSVTGLEDSSFTAVEYETASHHDLPVLVFHIAGQAKPMRSDLPHDTLEAIRTENVWVERFKNGQLKTHMIKRVEDVEEFEVALSTALVHFQAASGDRAG